MSVVLKASIAEMKKFLNSWYGDGTDDESAFRIASSYMSINGFENLGPDATGDKLMFREVEEAQQFPMGYPGDVVIITCETLAPDAVADPDYKVSSTGQLCSKPQKLPARDGYGRFCKKVPVSTLKKAPRRDGSGRFC